MTWRSISIMVLTVLTLLAAFSVWLGNRELLAQGGLYARLHALQVVGDAPAAAAGR